MRHLKHSNAITVARRPQDTGWWLAFLAGATIAYLACAIHSVYMDRVRIQQELFERTSLTPSTSPGSHRGAFSEAAGHRLVSVVQSLGEGTDPRTHLHGVNSPPLREGGAIGLNPTDNDVVGVCRAHTDAGIAVPVGWVASDVRTVHAPPPSAVDVSVYSSKYHGRRTASGARYDHRRGLTAATSRHGRRPALPFGSAWEVEYKGRTVRVTITDTGSYRPRRARYWLDLSGEAWRQLTAGAKPSRIVARMRRVK